MSAGHVALVGAGPGDPALLTLRAVELIRAADVVAHDELVSEAILTIVPARAELLAVGRRIGQGKLTHRLHPEVRTRALRGQRVVRLKAGDPLIFGRGGEEAEELAESGIPFEIVPGISAALGAAAYAGIPLTHRGCSAQVVFATGHQADGGLPPPATLGGRTMVLYMSAHELAANLAAVVANGWPPSTPAALVASATSLEEQVVQGTLATLAEMARRLGVPLPRQPALVIIGDVVERRAKVDWRQQLPLRGRSIVVARTRPGGSEIGRKLRDRGAIVMELPYVERHALSAPFRSGASASHGVDGTSAAVSLAPARWPARVDLVVLPASLAALALYSEAPESLLRVPAVAMGPRTGAQARASGARDVREVPGATVDSLLATVVEVLAPRSTATSGPAHRDVRRGCAVSAVSHPPEPQRGLLVVYTGHGKGKTTAALGMVFRALGRGLRVTVVQFIKGKWKTGERAFAETLPGVRFLVMGLGFTWESDDLSRDKAAARAAWAEAQKEILSGERDLVVLDELTYTFHYGFLEVEEVMEALRARPLGVHVVVTGRDAPDAIVGLADLVTEMKLVKHPFQRGEKARPGVDF